MKALFLFVLIIFNQAACCIAFAASSQQQASMQAPIFYATSRRWTGHGFDNERGSGTQHAVGMAKISIPNKDVRWDMVQYFKRLENLGWSQTEDKSKQYQIIKCDRFKNLSESFQQIEQALEESKGKEITVVVHGYHNSFEDSLITAATFESYFKGLIIDYTWPAAKKGMPDFISYNTAQNNVGWSQQPFTDYIEALLQRFPNHKINIVCHSMGSRLVVGALHDLFPKGIKCANLNEIVFTSPDFDAATFKNRAGTALSAAEKVRIYVNPKDKAMWISAIFAGSYTRAGAPGADIEALRSQSNTEIYDFGPFGGGATGHDIPYLIISNMHKYGRPGGQWRIIRPPLKLVKVSRAG